MKLVNNLILAVAICLLWSCSAQFKVYDKGGQRKKGVPFYTQKGIIKQQTQYLFSYLEVTFSETTVEEKPKTQRLANRRVANNEDLTDIFNKINELNLSDQSGSETLRDTIIALINSKIAINLDSIKSTDVQPIANFWDFDHYIDYTNPLYIQGNMPWLGTASFTAKINEKGTLSEVAATSDSQIDDLIATAAGLATPISNVKIAKIEADAAADELDENSKPRIYKLEVTEKGFLYTFYKIHCDGDCKDFTKIDSPIRFDLKGHYKRISYPVAAPTPKKAEEPSIKVSGNIVLPKEN